MKSLFASSLSALAASALFLAAGSTTANAADYTWDTVSGDGAAITAGSGAWSTTGTNWNSGGSNLVWAQSTSATASHNAIFAGTSGTHTVTLSGITNAQSVTFNSSGYTLTSGTMILRPTGTTNGNITVAAGNTATIDSLINYSNNAPATITSGSGATLNLGGSGANNSQYTFMGAGTINMTSGTYQANVGKVNVATFNQTSGTFSMQPNGLNTFYAINENAGRSVTYTMSGSSIINFNGQATGTNSFLAIGRTTGTAFSSTINVQGSANLNVGNNSSGRAGELRIASDANSNGTMNVSGGAVTVGGTAAGYTDNKIYFFKNGSGAGYTANLTQSGGTVNAVNGIQFGGTAGTYDAASSANLTLSGGNLYVGAQGITRTGTASTLPTNIKLQGGVIGASENWSSSLNMQLGTTSGGPVFQAATSGSASKNITLSGNLSNDDSVSGKLTKTGGGDLVLSGSNSYSGGTIINAGRIFINTPNSLPSSGAVTLNAAQLVLDASDSPTYSQNITINAGSNLAMRKAATLSNVSLATSGTVIFNQNDQATQSFSLGSNVGLTGDLNVRVGGGVGTPGGVTLTGIISGSAGSLTKSGTGTLTLSGSNTYTGATTVTTGTMALGANDVLPDASAVSIGAATLNAVTFTDTVGTLDPTGAATINLGAGATLAFADSSAVDWTGGTLNITGTFVSGTSMRFGGTIGTLTSTQLSSITSNGYSSFNLDENGYLTATPNTPTLISIVDNKYAGPIAAGTVVTYTVTFSQAMDATTITAADFDNAGDAGCTIGAVTGSGAVFTVQATATSAGTLILQIPTTASINNAIGNALVVPLSDDTTITVNSSPAPALTAANITDNKTGQLVSQNMPVTYTLTFSEDINASTVTAADFENAGTATITIGTITEISPGVFTVEVTPTGTGTLQLRIKANAEIRAEASGNLLDTTSAILDADIITVGTYLFWDTSSSEGITSGDGAWNTTAGNTAWNNLSTNVIWSQTSGTDASYGAVFGGDDGTANEHVVTVTGTMAADSLTFNSSGYQITSGTVSVMPTGTTNGGITVAAGKTATIDSAISYANNVVANITSGSGATLNLGGGASNSQYQFLGAGTINMKAGTYTANVGKMNAGTFNQSGGTYTMNLPSVGDGHFIGFNAGRSVSYTLSGSAIINANASGTANTNSFLAIGRGAGNTAYSNTLNVTGAANLNVGNATGMAGELLIAYDNVSNGTLNVSGGAANVGTGKTDNKIYFFKAGSGAGYTANMTQSGGTVTANGIQFGGTGGTYNAASSANLTLSGGVLYVGAQGITRGSGASALAANIRLQGGTVGASDNWSSSLDMKLGTTGTTGGPTFQAATSGTVSKNITLTGVLSDDTGATGTLTKTGAGTLTLSGSNTYTGATNVNAGTLVLGNAGALSASSSLAMANGTSLSLTTPSTVNALSFAGTGTLNFDFTGGAKTLTVSTTNGLTNSGTAGSITVNITGAAPAAGTYALVDYSGTLQGAGGYSAYTLGSVPAGKNYELNDSGSAVELVVTSNYTWTGAAGNEWSTATIAGSKNWTKDGGAIDYADDLGAIFDNTATSFIVDISGANVSPLSVAFNSGSYTLQGTHTIAGPGSVTVASGATLKLGSSNKLPDGAGAGNVAINGTLDLNGYSDTVNGLTGSGSVDNTAATTTSTLTVGANAGSTFSGSLKNTGGTLALSKSGNTDVILNGSNSYNGATTINQGRLFISSTNAFSPNTEVTVNNGASFVLNATGTYAQSITLNSGANLVQRTAATLSGTVALPTSGTAIFNNDTLATQAFTIANAQTLGGSLNIQVGGSGTVAPGAITLSGILSGPSGSLVKSGTGRLILRGANTFGGGVTIRNGTLESQATQTTLGSGTVTMGGTNSTGVTYLTGQNNSNPFVINAPASGDIVIGANGAGSGFTMSGGVSLNGNLTLQTFENVISGSTKASSNITGGVTGTGNLLLNNLGLAANVINISGSSVNHTGTITLSGTAATGDTTISAPIGANVTGITQSSTTSRLVLSGTNTYAGNTTVNAGTLRITQAPNPLNANTGNDASTITIAATGATLDLAYTGTDKVDKLFIGATQQADGVYGKLSSTLPVIGIAQIIGDGTLTVGVTAAPEIAVEQPVNTEIVTTGSQDFGSVSLGSNSELTFTVRNSGNADLELSGTPLVAVGGTHAADFSVTADPATPVSAAGTTTFTVRFTPSALGERSANLTIANNDSDEGSYVINLTGTGTGAPEIALEQPANTPIASGGSKAFGTVTLGSDTSLTFTIRNSGNVALSLSGIPPVAVSGTNSADFTVTADPTTPVSAAGTTTFTVRFTPGAAGPRAAALTIANNDSDEGSYVINLTGTGQTAFEAWSGGATFNADANGDGVSNGLAWILGAADTTANARSLLPTVSSSGTNMVYTFKRIQASINANTALTIELGTTLSAWPTTYTVGIDDAGSTLGVTIAKNSPSAGTDTVTLTVARGADAKKFVRLKAVLTP
jgi:autotransporter-associated beta strand protein